MENKEQEFNFYRDYLTKKYGAAYFGAIRKLSVPFDSQFDENGLLKKELYLTDKEKDALMYAFPETQLIDYNYLDDNSRITK